ncbi:hypothetical protein [Lentibacillus cibarius]|uniref:Uncharacterized protein n=1 Tax=Lentibacillus cibarius TaxID=2583219 RepID=A0A5S3QGT2_9BACI|nr:hypothetical protein [Lentibacillus cibarius]TMN20939.1 hypothetical protein FFL34_01555 [Lentibacillus cibarius]
MQKKTLFILLMISMFLFVAACSSDKEASPENNEGDAKNEQKSEREKVFEETDKVAKKFYKAGFELNIPVAYEMLSPKGKEELENQPYVTGIVSKNGDDIHGKELINKQDYKKIKNKYTDQFKDFEKLNDEYEIRRYGYVYGESSKEVIYYVEPWRGYEKDESDFNFISLKKNEKGEWKVKKFTEKKPDKVNDWKSGKVIHEYEKQSTSNGKESYGFEEENK